MLQSVKERDPSLVLEASTWMLKNEPEHALRLFIQMKPPLPTKLVLSHLKAHAPHLQTTYLENVLSDESGGDSAYLQNELVLSYFQCSTFLGCGSLL